MNTKTIAVLTSGGDAPGMNAAVRAVVRTAISSGMKVLGVLPPWLQWPFAWRFYGNESAQCIRYYSRWRHYVVSASPNCYAGGPAKSGECVQNVPDSWGRAVGLGGNGSFQGARSLSQAGIPCIGIPGTIDNDIASSDYTIGFDTAMNTAVDMIDALGIQNAQTVQCGGSHGSALRGYCHDDRYCRRRYCDFSAGIAFWLRRILLTA